MERIKFTPVAVVEGAKPVVTEFSPVPGAPLDEKKVCRVYFSQASGQYRETLKSLDLLRFGDQITPKRMLVCIPSSHEESHIYRTLASLSGQPKEYLQETEVSILDNLRAGEEPDDTLEEIIRFHQANLGLSISYSRVVVPESMPYGNIRKILFDSTLLRAIEESPSIPNHILISCDADVYGFSDNYFQSIAAGLSSSQSPKILVGSFVYPSEALRKYPLLEAAFLFHRAFRTIAEQDKNYVPWTSGRTTAFMGSAYAAMGGLDGTINRASDIEIGRRTVAFREQRPNIHVGIERAGYYVVTDPRRVLSKMSLPDRNYSDEFEDADWARKEKVYGQSWEDFSYPTLERLTVEGLEKEFGGILIKKAYRQGFVRQLRDLSPEDNANLALWLSDNLSTIQQILNSLHIAEFKLEPQRDLIINGTSIPRILKLGDISGLETMLSQT